MTGQLKDISQCLIRRRGGSGWKRRRLTKWRISEVLNVKLIAKDSIFLNELSMHWAVQLRKIHLFTNKSHSLGSNILILSQKAKGPSEKSAVHGSECSFKNQVRHCLRQLRSGTAHAPLSLHNIRQQQKSRVSVHIHTQTQEWGLNWTGSEKEVLEARFVNPTLHHAWQR